MKTNDISSSGETERMYLSTFKAFSNGLCAAEQMILSSTYNAVIHDNLINLGTGEDAEFLVLVSSVPMETSFSELAGLMAESYPNVKLLMWLDLLSPHAIHVLSTLSESCNASSHVAAVIEKTGLAALRLCVGQMAA